MPGFLRRGVLAGLVGVLGVLAGWAIVFQSKWLVIALTVPVLLSVLLIRSPLMVYLLIFLIPFRDRTVVAFFGYKEILAILVVVQALVSHWRERKPITWSKLDLAVGIYVTVVLLGTAYGVSVNSGTVAAGALSTGLAFLLSSVVYLAVRMHGAVLNIRTIGVIVALSAAATSLVAIMQGSLVGTPIGSLLITSNTESLTGRMIGTFDNPNYLATFLGTSFVIVFVGLWQELKTWFWRVPVLLLVGWAVWLTFSRGAILSAAAVLMLYSVLQHRGNRTGMVARLAAVGTLLGSLPWVYGSLTSARLQLISDNYSVAAGVLETSDQWRREMLRVGLDMFLAHPIFGTGYGTFSNLSGYFSQSNLFLNSHNQYVGIWAEMGLIGGIAFIGLVGTVLIRSLSSMRNNSVTAAVAAGAVGFLINALTINPMDSLQVVGYFWVAVAVLAVGEGLEEGAPATQQVNGGARHCRKPLRWTLAERR